MGRMVIQGAGGKGEGSTKDMAKGQRGWVCSFQDGRKRLWLKFLFCK